MEDEAVRMPIDVRALDRRAQRYSRRCERWLGERDKRDVLGDATQPLVIVSRLSQILPAEVRGAIEAWLRDDGGELGADPEDAAAIALVAIEKSRDAWLALVRTRQIRALLAEPFVTDLVWLKHEIERAFPATRTSAGAPNSD